MNYLLRFTALAAALAFLSCRHGDQRDLGRREVKNPTALATAEDENSRELRAAQLIMDVLEKHAVATAVNVDARYLPNGDVATCDVESRDPDRFPRGRERELLVQEICQIVRDLGKPRPPASLSFGVSFSVPMLGPPEE